MAQVAFAQPEPCMMSSMTPTSWMAGMAAMNAGVVLVGRSAARLGRPGQLRGSQWGFGRSCCGLASQRHSGDVRAVGRLGGRRHGGQPHHAGMDPRTP